MFTWLNKQGVRSSEGFDVQCVARFEMEYREGGRVMTVYVEPGRLADGRQCEIISPDAFKRWNGSHVDNSPEEQQRLLKNFTAAMAFQGLAVSVE
jgi:hypothetical protein